MQRHIVHTLTHLDSCFCPSRKRIKIQIIHLKSLDTLGVVLTNLRRYIRRMHRPLFLRCTRRKKQHTYHYRPNCSTAHTFSLLFLTLTFPHSHRSRHSWPVPFPSASPPLYYCRT